MRRQDGRTRRRYRGDDQQREAEGAQHRSELGNPRIDDRQRRVG